MLIGVEFHQLPIAFLLLEDELGFQSVGEAFERKYLSCAFLIFLSVEDVVDFVSRYLGQERLPIVSWYRGVDDGGLFAVGVGSRIGQGVFDIAVAVTLEEP